MSSSAIEATASAEPATSSVLASPRALASPSAPAVMAAQDTAGLVPVAALAHLLGDSRPHAVVVEHADGLRAIELPGVNLCVWTRALGVPRLRELDRLVGRARFDVDGVVAPDGAALAALLPPVEGAEALYADVAEVFGHFVQLLSPERVRVQLHTVMSDGCRLFHADFVGVRLIVTYVGPGTEWTTDDNVDRAELRRTDVDPFARRPLVDARRIRRMPRAAVALLKGEAWPDNRGRGLVHRSPPIAEAGLRRLRLVLDVARAEPDDDASDSCALR